MVQMYDGILTNQTLFGEMKDVRPDLFVIDDTWLRNTLSFLFTTTFGNPFCDNTAVARYAPEMPYVPLNMLNSRAEIWLLQSDHILDYPKPSLPNVKLIGGMAASPAKPLPPEFQSFMDGALDGVIVVSFGSMILGLPKEVGEDILMTAFLKIRTLKVVFRSNLTTPDPTKILTAPWVPQNDLLAHPNTKVFLTHCGVSGQYQALYHAVPMVGVPFDFDQFYNAKRMEARGFGKSVSLRGLNVSQLVDAIVTVATDPHYRQTIGRASKLFREQFGVPLEKAAYCILHLETGAGT
nr:hypothetical protein BaRGS_017295 [Batillaria attramentaria]